MQNLEFSPIENTSIRKNVLRAVRTTLLAGTFALGGVGTADAAAGHSPTMPNPHEPKCWEVFHDSNALKQNVSAISFSEASSEVVGRVDDVTSAIVATGDSFESLPAGAITLDCGIALPRSS